MADPITLRPEQLVVPPPGLDSIPPEDLKVMVQALGGDHDYASTGLPDDDIHRHVWEKLRAEVRAMPAGVDPDLPQD